MNNFEYKQQRILNFLEEQDLEALVLYRACRFAARQNGRTSYINLAITSGKAALLGEEA